MTNYELPRPSYRELLDTATQDIAALLDLDAYEANLIGLRDMIRTIYCAASNANAISEDSDFARMIFIAACNCAMTHTIMKLTKIFSSSTAMRLKDLPANPFTEVIERLLND